VNREHAAVPNFKFVVASAIAAGRGEGIAMNREPIAVRVDPVVRPSGADASIGSNRSASVAIPGSRNRTSGADGFQLVELHSGPAAEAVRGRSLLVIDSKRATATSEATK
jgi:hypothetical protein